ncbi:MAG: hypothetical protein QOD66_3982, partial [Solirubrobacteraceae bacterium]|nr:hypothetical protein [Solirubrobacteraceae bacterium]
CVGERMSAEEWARSYERSTDQLRQVTIVTGFIRSGSCSALISM